jgi:ubiquinone/menaquinone biosynthesis C-methylase UbiE
MTVQLVTASTESMREYYAQRAAYYERVYAKPERQADLQAMKIALPKYFENRHVLEIACGTGYWTPYAAAKSKSWLATDLNVETLNVARAKPELSMHAPTGLSWAIADAYSLAELGDQKFDAAFAGCWWSHVLLAQLPVWLRTLHARLLPGSTVVMLDNSFIQTSNLPITRKDAEGNTYQNRTLDNGSTHEVLKNFPTQEQAFALIEPYAKNTQWLAFEHYWMLIYTLK